MKKLISMIMLTALIVTLSTLSIADDPVVFDLAQGENAVYTTQYFPSFSVEQLIKHHPQIQSVSMQLYGQTYGYVNIFGGIGTPFLIQPGVHYEIHASEPITLDFLDATLIYG